MGQIIARKETSEERQVRKEMEAVSVELVADVALLCGAPCEAVGASVVSGGKPQYAVCVSWDGEPYKSTLSSTFVVFNRAIFEGLKSVISAGAITLSLPGTVIRVIDAS